MIAPQSAQAGASRSTTNVRWVLELLIGFLARSSVSSSCFTDAEIGCGRALLAGVGTGMTDASVGAGPPSRLMIPTASCSSKVRKRLASQRKM